MCVCVCVCVCVYIYIYVCVCVCVYIYIIYFFSRDDPLNLFPSFSLFTKLQIWFHGFFKQHHENTVKAPSGENTWQSASPEDK